MDVMVGINFDEIEFYTDLAMNESQRWIEFVTRERFFDEDDFLYSLRHGTQLRKVLNIVRPGCISLVSCNELPSCSRRYYDDNSDQSDEDEIEPWTVQFLTVCRTVLNFNDRQVFRVSDLDALIDENGRQGCLPVETLSKIRRVVITIYELAILCESLPSYVGPKIDKTAVEPLVNYHRRINEENYQGSLFSPNRDLPSKNLYRGLQKDVKFVLNAILDRICTEEESSRSSVETRELEQIEDNKGKVEEFCKTNNQLSTYDEPTSVSINSNHILEENISTVVDDRNEKSTESNSITTILLPRDRTYREKVSNYLKENDFDNVLKNTSNMSSTDNDYHFHEYIPKSPISPGGRSDNVFYGSAADLSRDYKPGQYHHQREYSDELTIPTRTLTKMPTPLPTKQALKFVSSQSHLHEAAKEQIDKMHAQHVSREQLQKEDEFQKEWKNDFDSWADKRRAKSISALRRRSDREDLERLPTPTNNKTGFFNKSPTGVGRSLNDVRYDYNREEYEDDDDQPTRVNSAKINFNSSSSDYQDGKTKTDRRSFGEPRATMKQQYGLDLSTDRHREDTNYYPDSEDDGKSSGRYQSTPLHSANSSMDHTLDHLPPQREPIVETVRETTKTYEKRTTFIPQTSPNAKSHFNTMTSSSQQQNTHSKQTLSYDRSPMTPSSRLIHVEGDPDSGVEMNHASPMSSPLRCDDSLSPNSQSSTDGGKVGKISPTHDLHHHHQQRDSRHNSTNTHLLEMVPNVQYSQQQTSTTINKNHKEFTITIKQRTNSEKGFGFSLKGGKDKHEPILVATVIVGSSADKSQMQINDEVLEINGEPVADKVLAAVNLCLREAIRTGEIEILLRRKLPKTLDTALPIKPAVSPRFARKQTSFDETRERFEKERLKNEVKPTKTTVPGKLPTYSVFQASRSTSSGSGSGSGSPSKLERTSPKFDYQSDTTKTSPKETSFSKNAAYSSSPSIRRRDPGRITDFVPEVDRETSEYKLTLAQGRQSPGRILDFVPENERSKSHRPVYTSQGVDELDSAWNRERRIIEGAGESNFQQHPGPDAEYHDAPASRVHYDLPHMRPSVGGDSHSESSKDSADSGYLNRSTNDVPIVPVYNKSVAAMKVSKALNSKVQTPKVAYETTYVEESHRLPSVSSNKSYNDEPAKFYKPSVSTYEVSSLSYQNGNLTESSKTEHNYGSDTMSFLEAKFRRMNSTRRLRKNLHSARLSYYGITVDDGSSSDDSFDLSPYLNRIKDYELYDLASKIISTSGTDLYFHGPTPFTYEMQREKNSPRLISVPKPAPRRRTVVVVPVRTTKDMRKQSDKNGERLNSTSSYVPSTPRIIDTPTPYSHVKREPVSFSLEPIPGVIPNGQQRPTPSARVHNDAVGLYSKETAMNEVQRVFGRRDTAERLNAANSVEMRYMELASNDAPRSATIPRPMPHNDNINEHWMVREAEDLRLTDQIRTERRMNRQSTDGNNLIELDVSSNTPRPVPQYPYTSNTIAQPRYENNGDYGYDGAEYSTRAFAEINGTNLPPRPPSPKFPPNSILNQRFGTKLPTDDENRIVAVSDRQICAHCNKELGRGAAMTIESLGLYYHLNCFKCYVCQVPLGDGIHGADVRVKDRRLNCQSCYINDQTGEFATGV